jgi:hypothetical protein
MIKDEKKRNKRRQRRQARVKEAIDNWDIVDISENKPSDYWFFRESREEYCKELYDTPDC